MSVKRNISNLVIICSMITLAACQVEKQPEKIGAISTASQLSSEDTHLDAEASVYEVGDIIRFDETVLVVLGWDQPLGGDLNPPDQGKKYLVVDVMIANQGERSFISSPVFQMSLKDPDGQKYNLNGKANLASGSNQPNGEINPGEAVRGKIGFHVPEEQSNFIFVFEVNLVGFGEVSVNLGPTPVAMAPPEDLNLGQGQEIYQIGEMIEISDLVITALGVSYPTGTNLVKPREGFQFVAVDVQLENQGSNIQEITSIIQMYLKDATGQKHTFHLGAQSLLDVGLPDDELHPGERVRGQIGFQVPEDAGNLVFVFDAEVFGFGKVFISLD